MDTPKFIVQGCCKHPPWCTSSAAANLAAASLAASGISRLGARESDGKTWGNHGENMGKHGNFIGKTREKLEKTGKITGKF